MEEELAQASKTDPAESGVIEKPKGRGYRHKMAYMIFSALAISYCLRFNLSMALIGMVNSPSHNEDEPHLCNHLSTNHSTAIEKGREFNWSPETQGLITSSFFVGYLITQIPAGLLAQKYGGKWVVGFGVFVTALLALCIPVAARAGEKFLMAVRFVQGMSQGLVPSAAHVLLAQWTPPPERSLLEAIAFSGNQAGALTAMLLSGLIIYTNKFDGWPGIFYISGGLGIVWCFSWALFAYNKPWDNPDISAVELKYLERSLEGQIYKEYTPPPWKQIFKSKAVWAVVAAQAGNGWGIFTILNILPMFVSKVLHYDMQQTSWISGLPFLGMLLVALIAGFISNHVISNQFASTVTARKMCNSIGHWIPSLAFLVLAFTGCDRTLALIMIFIGVSASGAATVGFHVNHTDIAPQHAGILAAIGNTVSNLFVWITPIVFGRLSGDDENLYTLWKILFLIISGILFVDNLIYISFASGSVQEFNKPKPKSVA